MIYQGVDESTFDNIAHVKKAKEAWEIQLHKSFQGVDKEKEEPLQVLRDEFKNFERRSSENIGENVMHLKMGAKDMKRNDERLDSD